MDCPACNTANLKPASLEAGLPCYRCAGCKGALVSLPAYLAWQDNHSDDATTKDFAIDPTDTKHAIQCKKCSRIMVKFKILHNDEHRLDYCFGCEEVWLDGGEWAFLKSQGLETKITAITTAVWQRQIREQQQEEFRESRMKAIIGAADYPRVTEFKDWLDKHSSRDQILRYLQTNQ